MSEPSASPTDGLWSRLRLIEGQPLGDRAEAYTALHEELSRRLEGGGRRDDDAATGPHASASAGDR